MTHRQGEVGRLQEELKKKNGLFATGILKKQARSQADEDSLYQLSLMEIQLKRSKEQLQGKLPQIITLRHNNDLLDSNSLRRTASESAFSCKVQKKYTVVFFFPGEGGTRREGNREKMENEEQ